MRIFDSAVTMTNSIVSNNEAGYGGGISMRSDSSSLILRQSTFSGNDASFIAPSGDDIYVMHSPTLSIINTIIPTAANNIVVTSGNIPTWTSCADDPCSVQPHTGTCSAVDASDVKLGVMCLDVTATEETCGACNDTSLGTKTTCEASSTWTSAWAVGNWTARTVLQTRCDSHDACKAACDADSSCEIYQENIYYDSTKVYGGANCTDPAACEAQCNADADCEGWSSACSDTSKTTEDTCGSCTVDSQTSSTACVGHCELGVPSLTAPDTSDTNVWTEYKCNNPATSGKFTISSDCTLSDQVSLAGELTLVGSNKDMDNLVTITAANEKRHFYLNSESHKLHLWHVKLTGGYTSQSTSDGGAAIRLSLGGLLNLYYSEVSGNTGGRGGAIWLVGQSATNRNAVMNSYGSLFKNNEASHGGGAIELIKTVATFVDSTIDSNNGDSIQHGGGLKIDESAVTMTNCIVSNNVAGRGGGIFFFGSSSLILRQSTFSGNDAEEKGDDIYVYMSDVTLSIINTIIPTAANNIVVRTGRTATWTTCADDPCSVQPHTGTCAAVSSSDVKLGVTCALASDYQPSQNSCGFCSGATRRAGDICESDAVLVVAAGEVATCYIDIGGMILCMGHPIGNFGSDNLLLPIAVTMPVGLTATQISMSQDGACDGAGCDSACAIMSDSNIYCWGYSNSGRLGIDPVSPPIGSPMMVNMPTGLTGKQLSRGSDHSCAIMSDDNIYCWGENTEGELGDGTTVNKPIPTAVTMPTVDGNPLTSKQIALGYEFSCAIMSDDNIYCWGRNRYGSLGIGSFDNSLKKLVPEIITMPSGLTAKQLGVGKYGGCAIMSDDNIYCWGPNWYGMLGIGTDDMSGNGASVPTATTMPVGLTAKQISVGGFDRCAIMSDDNIYCWGDKMGAGGANLLVPTAITMPSGLKGKQISVGYEHFCAIMDNDSLYCFGKNGDGQLGIGSTMDQTTLQQVLVPEKTWTPYAWTDGVWTSGWSAIASSYVYGSEASGSATSQVKALAYGPEGLEASAVSHKKPSSDFCDNKLPGTFVHRDKDLYVCLGDECAETSTCEYRRPACFNGDVETADDETTCVTYELVTSGGTPDTSLVLNAAECEAYATSIGRSYCGVTDPPTTNVPYGCFLYDDPLACDNNGGFRFNDAPTSTKSCDISHSDYDNFAFAGCVQKTNTNVWDPDHRDKTVFKTRTCSHDMQHFTGLRDECPVGKCRIDERHKVKKTCHQSVNPDHSTALSFAADGISNYVIDGANDPEVRVCANEAISFTRSDAGHPLRVVAASECTGCDTGTHSNPANHLSNWVDVQGSSTETYTFTSAGNYYYLCTAHSNMVGALIVEDCMQNFNGEIGTAAGQCERLYNYTDSTSVYSGTACTDASDCELQCSADADCEGYTSRCSDPSKTTEDSCGTCSDPAKTTQSTCGDCSELGYQADAVASHTAPDTSNWGNYVCTSPATSGTFIFNGDCTLSAEVTLTGDLTLVGSDTTTLKTMTAATNKRHFRLGTTATNNAGRTLTLWYVKLTGGNIQTEPLNNNNRAIAGSILIWTSGGTLNLYYSEIIGNEAKKVSGYGGAVSAIGASSTNKNAIVNVYNSIIKDNKARTGAAFDVRQAVLNVYDSHFDNNLGEFGGVMYAIESDVTMTNTIISNHVVTTSSDFSGIAIGSDGDNSFTFRQVSFINSDVIGSLGSGNTFTLVNTLVPTHKTAVTGDFTIPTFLQPSSSLLYEWQTCADNPCSVAPHTGTCSAVDSSDVKLGVICVDGTATQQNCGTCNDTSLATKPTCEASGTWTSAWNAGTWTAGVWADIGSAYAFGKSTGTGGASKQREDITMTLEVTEDCTSSDTVHCSDPQQVTTNSYSYASSVKIFGGANCTDMDDCKQQCTDDPSCQGYSSACSDDSKGIEETCGSCSDTDLVNSTVCQGYCEVGVSTHTAPSSDGLDEWTCSSPETSGIFKISSDCQLTSEVILNGELTLIGQGQTMNTLKTITAATSGKRHFKLNGATHKLHLWHVKLTGGDVTGDGGAIMILTSGGVLNLYYSEISGNKASGNAGAIKAVGASDTNRNAIVNIYNSIIKDNEATSGRGGGMYLSTGVVATIYDTTIDSNEAKDDEEGGGVAIKDCVVTMTNTIISNNVATWRGGGLSIRSDSTVVLRQVSFINNDGNSDGDEIHVAEDPTISIINTVIPTAANSIVVKSALSGVTPTWTTCADDPCTEAPYIGTCAAVSSSDAKLGVTCPAMGDEWWATEAACGTCTECSDTSYTTEAACVEVVASPQIGYALTAQTSHTTPVTTDTNVWSAYTCATPETSGKFTISSDCTLGAKVTLTGDLTIIGQTEDMDNLVTITAKTGERHFTVYGDTLNLWHVKLTGGDVTGYNAVEYGGAILLYKSDSTLNLYYSMISGNKGKKGGGIAGEGNSISDKDAIVNIYNSIIKDNEGTSWGAGGIYTKYTVGTIYDTIIDNNEATSGDGGGIMSFESVITMTNTIVSNNVATSGYGGGMRIGGSGSTITLRQSTFTNNAADDNIGDQMYAPSSPDVWVINTVVPTVTNDMSTGVTWKTCSNSPCSVAPFTGSCAAVDASDVKLGVTCAGGTAKPAYVWGPQVGKTQSTCTLDWDDTDYTWITKTWTSDWDSALASAYVYGSEAASTGGTSQERSLEATTLQYKRFCPSGTSTKTVSCLDMETPHSYAASTAVFEGNSCADPAACEAACTADAGCEGWSSACSDTTKTSEDTCGSCSVDSYTTSTECEQVNSTCEVSAAPTPPDTSGWTEYDCDDPARSGTFILNDDDCTLGAEVILNGDLTIVGTSQDMSALKTMTAATGKRHFTLGDTFKTNNAGHTLTLWHIKLTGADIRSASENQGGAIFISQTGGTLNLYYSEVSGNKANFGGGIYTSGASTTNRNAILNIYNGIIKDNTAKAGGGINMVVYTTATIEDTTIDNNEATSYDAGGCEIQSSDVTMTNTIISNNDAAGSGGGLYIRSSSTVTLRQVTFINNDAGNDKGDEIYILHATISLINTVVPTTANNIYQHENVQYHPTWNTCSNNLCSVAPFTGTCAAVDASDSKLGVTCALPSGYGTSKSTCGSCSDASLTTKLTCEASATWTSHIWTDPVWTSGQWNAMASSYQYGLESAASGGTSQAKECPAAYKFGTYEMAYAPECTATDYMTCDAIDSHDKTRCLEQGCSDGSDKDESACEAAGESYDNTTAANVFFHAENVATEADCDSEHSWGAMKVSLSGSTSCSGTTCLRMEGPNPRPWALNSMQYSDLSVKCYVDGVFDSNTVVSGDIVNWQVSGSYDLVYTCNGHSVTRTVVVA